MSNLALRMPCVHRDLLDGNVPIFQEMIDFATPAEAASSSSDVRIVEPEPATAPEAPSDSEHEEEVPANTEARLIKEAANVVYR